MWMPHDRREYKQETGLDRQIVVEFVQASRLESLMTLISSRMTQSTFPGCSLCGQRSHWQSR